MVGIEGGHEKGILGLEYWGLKSPKEGFLILTRRLPGSPGPAV